MDEDLLAAEFEAHRARLTAVAHRMLGSSAEADDAVQEAWLRLSRSDAAVIDNLGGWLTTVVARLCLNQLQSRRSRREDPLDDVGGAVPVEVPGARSAPEGEALLADSVGAALLVVLDTLTPAERLAFVLHDLFGVPFEEVAQVLGKSPAAARQLASRARRRVQGTRSEDGGVGGAERVRQRRVVEAFLAASRSGDFSALLELLDPGVVLRLDPAAARMGAEAATGAEAVAKVFSGRAQAAEVALLDGSAGLVWRHAGTLRVAFRFTVGEAAPGAGAAPGPITAIDMVADLDALASIDVR
jgi:RNA polymerase sigma factor (sigma-70 family)